MRRRIILSVDTILTDDVTAQALAKEMAAVLQDEPEGMVLSVQYVVRDIPG